jgi:hypothetical protein
MAGSMVGSGTPHASSSRTRWMVGRTLATSGPTPPAAATARQRTAVAIALIAEAAVPPEKVPVAWT